MMSSVGYRRRLLMWAGCSRYGHRLIAPLFAPSVEVYRIYPAGRWCQRMMCVVCRHNKGGCITYTVWYVV